MKYLTFPNVEWHFVGMDTHYIEALCRLGMAVLAFLCQAADKTALPRPIQT